MNRKIKFINYILPILFTMGALFFVVYLCSIRYFMNMGETMVKFLLGALVAGFLHALIHELGHLYFGKKNSFAFSEMVVWFFKWKKHANKIKFQLIMMGNEAGYTQMIPTNESEVEKGLKAMTLGGLIGSFLLMLVGVVPIFIANLPSWVFCIWVMLFPIGIYYFLGNILPKESMGVRNDGAVLYGIKKNDDQTKILFSLLKIQAFLYNGKTPSEIDEKYYFDLPQLAEDNPNFAMLLSAKYSYYLDKGDYENAKKTTERLLSLEDYIPRDNFLTIMADCLYNHCTFDYNETKADNLMEDLEGLLNGVNTATNIRIKLAYLVYVVKEKEGIEYFYNKGVKEAKKSQIKGLGLMEIKLLEQIFKDGQMLD